MRAPMATASTRGDVQVAAEAPPATRHTPDSQSAPEVHAQPPSCPSAVESAHAGAPSKIVAEMVTKMPSPPAATYGVEMASPSLFAIAA